MECEQPQVEATISSDPHSVYTVCFSPDETKLCSAGSEKKVILTNLQDNKTEKVFTGHKRSIWGSDFSSNGNFLITASADSASRIWNVESKNGNSIELKGHSDVVRCVQYFHKDPNKVISCGDDQTIKIWDIERKKEISTLKGCDGFVYSVNILHDNQTIVSGEDNNENQLRIWDFRSGKCLQILDHHKSSVTSVQFHSNTFSLASGSWDQTIKIFDFRTFQLLQKFQEHTNWLATVCFHPSGKFLLSGSFDSKIKLFDLSEKKVLYTLNDHSRAVRSAQFSPDGKSFASGGHDNNVFVWNFPLGKMFRDEKEIDEDERVRYLIQQDLLIIDGDTDDLCERNVLKIRIDDFQDLYFYKFFSVT